MYFRFATIVALLSAPLFALAAQPNPFKIPQGGLSATAGTPLDLAWTPTTTGTVTLVLRSGESTDLKKGVTIASHIDNSGSFTWTPADSLPQGSDYTIEIIDDSDPAQVNYTPPFTLESNNVAPSSTASSATASSTSGSSTGTSGSSSGSSAAKTATITSGSMSAVSTGSTSGAAASTSGSRTGTGASFQPTAPSSSQGSAARATAMAGMLGAVALGAFAL